MKTIYKFILLALTVYSSANPQITEIARLLVQNPSQSIKESAPVWLSENEIMIFYVNEMKDTIFSTKSIDRGITWQKPIIIQQLSVSSIQEDLYLTVLKVISGRILLAWSIKYESMKLIYSDDEGVNWSQPISILGGGSIPALQRNSEYLNLTQWDADAICLSFSNVSGTSFYKLSSDDGISWSTNPFEFPGTSPYQTRELSIVSTEQYNLLGIYERQTSGILDIYSRRSTDFGLNWSEPQKIAGETQGESRPKVSLLENGNIILVYQKYDVNVGTSYSETNIYYKISSNKGAGWLEEIQFTKYIGEDNSHSISTLGNKTFITFATERYSEIMPLKHHYQLAYGVLQESEDKFTPPKVYHAYAPQELIDYEKKEFVYRITVIDDEAVESVTVAFEDSAYVGEVFDDGMHNDGEANDSIFANTFPFINPRYLNGYTLTVNNIYLPLNNAGVLADVNVIFGQKATIAPADNFENKSVFNQILNLGGQGSLGQYDGGGFLYAAGFFISGYVNGSLFANGVASGSLVADYQPGIVGSNPDDPMNTIYIINKNDPPFGNSWQRWKDAVLLGAEFYDGDNDGIYKPVDKNFNDTWDMNEDMPPLIGDEIVWCVYNDGIPAEQRRYEVDPIGVEVQQTLFASGNPDLEDVIFIKYKLTNTGLVSDVLDSIYFSPWDDTDIGDATDDLGGCDTLMESLFTYNSSEDAQYGVNPPAVFTTLLQGPVIESQNSADTAYIRNGEIIGAEIFTGYVNLGLHSFIGYTKAGSYQGDPQDVAQVWNYVQAKDRAGNLLDPCDTILGKVYGNVDCSEVNPLYWFSGDPVVQNGWLDNRAMDDRKFSSIGPITMGKDKPITLLLALAVGRGTDYINSVTVARENVQRAIAEYENNFATMTYTPPPPVPVTNYILYQNYPNPFNPTTTIRYELPQDGIVTLDIYDILGQKVKTLINEFKVEGRYEVILNSAGLASGVYIYQLRANDFITSKKMVLIR